jgi:hypothetical protein
MKSVVNSENYFNSLVIFQEDLKILEEEDNMENFDVVKCKQNRRKKTQNVSSSKLYNSAYLRFCNEKRKVATRLVGEDETEIMKKLEEMWNDNFLKIKNADEKKKRKSIAVKARYKIY